MPLLPSVFMFHHHLPLLEGWKLSQDRAWKVLMGLPVGSFHVLYLDAVLGRHEDDQYDAKAYMDLMQRHDYADYCTDLRECLSAYFARFGHYPDIGAGGVHDVTWWTRLVQHGTFQGAMWDMVRPVFADDYPPNLGRPNVPLFRAIVRDGAGSARPVSIAGRVLQMESTRLCNSCEGRANFNSVYMDVSFAGRPQYTQYATARITTPGHWQTLMVQGHDDHTILPDSGVWTDAERAAWEAQGIRVALGPDAIAATPVVPA